MNTQQHSSTVVPQESSTELYIHYRAATEQAILSEPIVLLGGWGFSRSVWGAFLERLNTFCHLYTLDLPGFGENRHFPQNIHCLMQQLPERAVYVGWSLGGMIATQLAHYYPQRVSRLVTLASNARFVACDQWPTAMESQVFDGFFRKVSESPQAAIHTFQGLVAQGSRQARQTLRTLKGSVLDDHTEELNGGFNGQLSGQLQDGLRWLFTLDNRQPLASLQMPSLLFFGSGDQLVPIEAVSAIQRLNHNADVHVLPSNHALHVDAETEVLEQIREFLSQGRYSFHKQAVASSFSRAAETYDEVAELQQHVGTQLMARFCSRIGEAPDSLPAMDLPVMDLPVMDLGCGTGFFIPPLCSIPEVSNVIGVDLAEGMLRYARERYTKEYADDDRVTNLVQNASWLTGDAEQLPLSNACLGGVFSSLAIQWCANVDQLFGELNRVMAHGAIGALATLGPSTLWELRQAWLDVDDYTHVNRFIEKESLFSSVSRHFDIEALEAHTHTLYYPNLRELSRALKSVGAHNVNGGKPAGLMGKDRLKKLENAYELLRTPSGLPLTYEIYELQIVKPPKR
ncbi:alpha/beta fold hydrolase [Marinibactrum halimedae]|uniref:Malonyl-[acyl-carrier protein] O-methyltransferase n=1 Tax=Marinibactrum halimedae TaxID=1444977 RepID=A0AA37T2M9_9GAMM|nr:alpha/beta fold hydrolase [Marinibactrum halimedae]MCD9458141.1 alpha/beta fold hydrolase [Marinibactrum halimedae]GLS25074.1 hypothetical protein GCM10007877_07880 [Marinibactrum halimedae]